MHTEQRWRFEVFLVGLGALELATVAAADVPHKPAALVVTALSVAVLGGWRRQPLAASVAAFAVLTVSVAITPRSPGAVFFGTLATFAIAGAINTEREAVVAWLAGAGMLGYAAWLDPLGGGTSDFLLSLAFGTTMWGAGLLVARRSRHVTAVLEQAREAERSREEQTRAALSEERATIARELHDVVSHGLSVVVVQTMAARSELADRGVDGAGEIDRHLDAVEGSARDALSEMRRMLGLLDTRHPNDGGERAEEDADPVPGLDRLAELIERTALGGSRRLHLDEDLLLPAGLEVTIYRIAQEALTNVAKHAPGADVDVSVDREGERVQLTVRNDPSPRPSVDPPLGAGRGLVGIHERVALYGGTVSVGATANGGFELSAAFPAPDRPDIPSATAARAESA